MTRSPAATLNYLARERILLLVIYILFSGCGSRSHLPVPSIEFTRIPPAAEGGPDKLDIIQGRVTGARPGEQIVLYARKKLSIMPVRIHRKWYSEAHPIVVPNYPSISGCIPESHAA
jgi:hypothetical protein